MPAEQQRASCSPQAVEQAARILHGDGEGTLLLMTGSALSEQGLALAERIAGKTGCTVMGPTFRPKMARGRGRFSIDRIHYVIENALPMLAKFRHIVLVESDDPVAFFAYPNKPSMLKPEGCDVHRMTTWGENSVAALEALAGAVKASAKRRQAAGLGGAGQADRRADLRLDRAGRSHARFRERDHGRRILTTGRGFFPPTAAAAPHDWLQNMGGSIGFSTPLSIGAAIACPDRKVITMVGDGSAMYTIQSLWTQARENLNIVTIVFANRIYQILRGEFDNVGAGEPGQRANDMLPARPSDAGLRRAGEGHGRARPRRHQRRRVQQGAGRSRRRTRAATDRSSDVSLADLFTSPRSSAGEVGSPGDAKHRPCNPGEGQGKLRTQAKDHPTRTPRAFDPIIPTELAETAPSPHPLP